MLSKCTVYLLYFLYLTRRTLSALKRRCLSSGLTSLDGGSKVQAFYDDKLSYGTLLRPALGVMGTALINRICIIKRSLYQSLAKMKREFSFLSVFFLFFLSFFIFFSGMEVEIISFLPSVGIREYFVVIRLRM